MHLTSKHRFYDRYTENELANFLMWLTGGVHTLFDLKYTTWTIEHNFGIIWLPDFREWEITKYKAKIAEKNFNRENRFEEWCYVNQIDVSFGPHVNSGTDDDNIVCHCFYGTV